MKTTVILLLLAATSAALQAQQPAPDPQGPPDLAVVKFTWRKERIPGWENNPFGPSFETYEAMRERLINERRIQQARNAGNKAEQARREDAAKMAEDAKFPKGVQKSERPRDGYRYKVQLTNAGAKTVKTVDWDYVFLDPGTGKEVARHQFTSDETIKPGKSKEVSVFYLTPPVMTISAEMLGNKNPLPFDERVVIVRLQYSDGSVWQRP